MQVSIFGPPLCPEKEYYKLPTDNLKTYPVYLPGREPAGYWDMLQKIGPKAFIETQKLKTKADWLKAERELFASADHIHQRTYDPKLIALARDSKALEELQVEALPDGTLPDVVWVPTEKGVALSAPSCSSCHTYYTPDGEAYPGAPYGGGRTFRPSPLVPKLHLTNRLVNASSPFFMGEQQDFGEWLYQAWSVPWRKDDIHQKLKTLTVKEYEEMRRWYGRSRGLPRWNGSIFHPHKTPDLVGVQERMYIDATALISTVISEILCATQPS